MPRGRYTNLQLTRAALLRDGRVSAHDATYVGLLDPDGGHKRNTRLGAVIYDLRKEGWDIDTTGGSGQQAIYILRSAPGRRSPELPSPGEPTRPDEPRGWQLPTSPAGHSDTDPPVVTPVRAGQQPRVIEWACPKCGAQLDGIRTFFGTNYAVGKCPTHGLVQTRRTDL